VLNSSFHLNIGNIEGQSCIFIRRTNISSRESKSIIVCGNWFSQIDIDLWWLERNAI
jgi:hypothetical protein